MFYAKVTERNPWGTKHEFYGFHSRHDRNRFVQALNDQAAAHRRYDGHGVWPLMWTKYDTAEAITAEEFHSFVPSSAESWCTDGDRWTFYMPATLFKVPERQAV